MTDPGSQRIPTQEIMLLDTVRRLERLREGRIAVHIHLSHLKSSHRREDFLRIATDIFLTSISAFEGQLFALESGDLFFIARNATIEALDNAVNRLRVLFSEDPLAQNIGSTQDQPKFCTWYNLEKDFDVLHRAVTKMLQDAGPSRQHPELDPGAPATKPLDPIRPETLSRTEQILERADVSNFLRRQTVCTIIEGQPPQPLFEEIYISIEDLQSAVAPGTGLLADPWLFRYLTQTLDKRVMNLLIRDGVNGPRPFSLNLNVATVLSPLFARFEAIITPHMRVRQVIEMNKLDVFSNMGAFIFARDYLHDRGFRLCLDGLTHHTMPYYDRARLGFDLIKIYWTPESIDDLRPEMIPSIRNIVMESGQARTILCRCENARALEIGQSLGIVMFQGRYVEHLLGLSQGRPAAPVGR